MKKSLKKEVILSNTNPQENEKKIRLQNYIFLMILNFCKKNIYFSTEMSKILHKT